MQYMASIVQKFWGEKIGKHLYPFLLSSLKVYARKDYRDLHVAKCVKGVSANRHGYGRGWNVVSQQ